MKSPWGKLPAPKPKESDEYGHKKGDPAFCAYTYKELTEGMQL